jgi:hypothetical protein
MRFLQSNRCILFLVTLIVLAFALPATAFGQGRGGGQEKKFYRFVNGHDARDGRWDGRGRRMSRSSVIYQPRPYYSYRTYTNGYPQTYYGNQYYTYGSSQPYYTNRYYSFRYSQPYFANRYSYSWANPTYRYDESGYRQRHQGNGVRIRVRWR